MAVAGSDRIVRPDRAATGLGTEVRTFVQQPSPRFISAVLVGAVIARVAVGRWALGDLVVAGAIVAAQPFTEWLVHVFVLHARPRRIFGRRVDGLLARKHRQHHADPRNLELIFVPMPVLVPGLLVIVALVVGLSPRLGVGLSGLVTGVAMLLTYEWTHFLIHSKYRPKSRYFRYVHRAHRLHHYRNERYWFGVTVHIADHVLRTFPAKDAVPVSPTARTLGVEPA
jgi:hypothetical protein